MVYAGLVILLLVAVLGQLGVGFIIIRVNLDANIQPYVSFIILIKIVVGDG